MDVRTQGFFIFPASKMQLMQLLFCDTCWLCFTTLNPAVLFSCFFFLHFIFIFCWISWHFGTVCQSPSPRPPTRRLSDASIKKNASSLVSCRDISCQASLVVRALRRSRCGPTGSRRCVKVAPLYELGPWKWYCLTSQWHELCMAGEGESCVLHHLQAVEQINIWTAICWI